jgi:hypothetical protein
MRICLLVVLALTLSACASGGSGEPVTTTTSVGDTAITASTSEAATTTAPASEVTQITRPAPNPDRPLAPDFSLTLSNGTEYEFASEVRPVYLVFWAEW